MALASLLETFAPYSGFHLATAGVCAIVIAGLVGCGRRARGRPTETRLRRALALSILVLEPVAEVHESLFRGFSAQTSFPLHVCDFAVWAACFALFFRSRRATTLAYFWGVGLCTQAFFSPPLREGLGYGVFWTYWISHTQIVGAGLYLLLVDGYRPRLRDFGFALGALAVYFGAMFGLNLLIDANYGYIGRPEPGVASLMDRLGPWPGRSFLMFALSTFAFLVVWALPHAADRLTALPHRLRVRHVDRL